MAQLTPEEVTLFLLDWMCVHKITDSAAKDMWSLVQMLLPGQVGHIPHTHATYRRTNKRMPLCLQVSLSTFNQVKQVLDEAQTKYVRRYHVCPNDCIVYYNSANFEQEYRHEHRTRYKTARTRRCSDVGLCLPDVSGFNRRRKHVGMYMHCRSDVVFILDFRCPVCNTGRYVVDPTDNNLRPAKVIFFFPLAPFVRSLFSRPDMVPHLYTDADGRPEGHVTRSRALTHGIHEYRCRC